MLNYLIFYFFKKTSDSNPVVFIWTIPIDEDRPLGLNNILPSGWDANTNKSSDDKKKVSAVIESEAVIFLTSRSPLALIFPEAVMLVVVILVALNVPSLKVKSLLFDNRPLVNAITTPLVVNDESLTLLN